MGEGYLATETVVGNRAHKAVLCDKVFGPEVVIKLSKYHKTPCSCAEDLFYSVFVNSAE